jgi:predicted RNA-binding protein with PUA-like domain
VRKATVLTSRFHRMQVFVLDLMLQPDASSWDKDDPHYDPKSSVDSPRWFRVDVQLIRKFTRCVTLDEIKSHPGLKDTQLVKRGRISVQHIRKAEWDIIVELADSDASSSPDIDEKYRRTCKK